MYYFTHTIERDDGDIDADVSYNVHRGRFALTEVTHGGADLATTGDEDDALIRASQRDYDGQRWVLTA